MTPHLSTHLLIFSAFVDILCFIGAYFIFNSRRPK